MIEIKLVLNMFAILDLTCFESNWIDKKMFSDMNVLQCFKSDVIINFYDVITIVHCSFNIESAQFVSILTFELTL